MNTILSVLPVGALSLILLFAVCFLIIHLIKLIKIGWHASYNAKPPEKSEEEKKAPASSSQEPVYYIVERKRRTKSSYGEPKRINFK